MKKISLLILLALGIPFAQVTRTLTGYAHKTIVFNSGNTATVISIDTTGSGPSWPYQTITKKLLGDTINIGNGSTIFFPDGSALLAEGAGAIHVNGTIVGDSALFLFLKGTNGANIGHLTTLDSANITTSVKFPFAGEFDNVVCVDDNGFGKECSTVGPGGDPVALASAIYDPGSTDTLVATSGMYAYVGSVVGSDYAATYNSGTTYAANAIVSYLTETYVSNVGSNIGNTPSSSPTQWTAYVHPADALTYVLNNLISHP